MPSIVSTPLHLESKTDQLHYTAPLLHTTCSSNTLEVHTTRYARLFALPALKRNKDVLHTISGASICHLCATLELKNKPALSTLFIGHMHLALVHFESKHLLLPILNWILMSPISRIAKQNKIFCNALD